MEPGIHYDDDDDDDDEDEDFVDGTSYSHFYPPPQS